VRAAGAVPAQPGPGAEPDDDLRVGLGVRLRAGVQRDVGLHQLPAVEAGGRRRAAADPDRPRVGLRAAGRAVNLRSRVGLAGGAVVLGSLAAVSAAVSAALASQLHAQLDAALVDAAKAAPLTLQEIKARLAATQGDGVPAFNKPLNLGSS